MISEAMGSSHDDLDDLKAVFISLVSHELRTPAGLMDGFLELALDEMASGNYEVASDYVERAKKNSSRLSRIVQELTDFSKVQELDASIETPKTSIGKALQDVFSIFEVHILEKKLEIQNNLNEEDRALKFDDEALIVIFRNIISNSVKFSPDSSPIKIFSEKEESEDRIAINFRDYADPIPKEKEKNIFDDFQQIENHLTRRYEGMGLGLAVAKRYSNFIGGDITLTTFEDGNQFSVTLPLDRKSSISEN